jgi:hypothetical protein
MRLLGKTVGMVTVLALAMVGCGDDESTTATTTAAAAAASKLDRFLVRANEAPGLSPEGEPKVLSSLKALVAEFGVPEADQRRLQEHGFEATVTQMLVGPSDAAGISTVDVFASEAGAAQELEYLVSNKEKDAPEGVKNFERFDVPGAPTAVGWTFDKPGGSKAADLHWSQGRCVMTLGSEPPLLDQLRAGVKALYERTGGRCP